MRVKDHVFDIIRCRKPSTHWRQVSSLLRQSDAVTVFWRNNDVITTSYVRWIMFFHEKNQAVEEMNVLHSMLSLSRFCKESIGTH